MSDRPTILVVDDERQIQLFLRLALEAAGYQVRLAGSARAALDAVAASPPDLVILDLGLPDLDGKAVIGQIRQTSEVPVVVLSARGAETEKINSLDLGANDFVQKPFGIGELLARIRVALRTRIAASDAEILALGNIAIDVPDHTITRDGVAIHLTPKEFELLVLLARHAGRVLTHRQILSKVWGPAHVDDIAYLRVLIGQLRQKIEPIPAEPRLILTETGIGYRVCGSDADTV